jgi:NADH-quinone oxidoreductase subunit G
VVTEGPNAAGAYLAGAVPHRRAGGARAATAGLDARAMLSSGLKACVLFGGIEPDADFAGHSTQFSAAQFTVAVTPHLPGSVASAAHVVLPIGTFAESAGTYVNLEGCWQSWAGAIAPLGEARPGWKVLRVLGNLLGLNGFDYVSSEEVRDAAAAACKRCIEAPFASAGSEAAAVAGTAPVAASTSVVDGAWASVPIYRIDALVRRSTALARTNGGQAAAPVS